MPRRVRGVIEDLFEVSGPETVVLRLLLQPGAGRTAVVGRHGDALKVRVAAAPEGGRANDACLALVASTLGVKADQLELTSGASSRSKRIRVTGVTADDVERRLADAIAEEATGNKRGSGGVRPAGR